MLEHVHGCLSCRPGMVPSFSPDDGRYHRYERCGVTFRAFVDGADPGYTQGVYEGPEGWVLFCGATTEEIHDCPNCTTYHEVDGYRVADHREICVVPIFGAVEVRHDCPSLLAERDARYAAAIRGLVAREQYLLLRYGREIA